MCSTDSELLLHPELLSTEALVHILLERKVKIDGLETMNRERLINIFNQFCLPHSQRKYKDTSARGKMLNKQQEERNKHSDTKQNEHFLSSKLSSTTLTSQRIKPPVDSNCQSNKKIKLASPNTLNSFLSNTTSQNNKRKIGQNCSSSLNSQPETKRQRVKITWP